MKTRSFSDLSLDGGVLLAPSWLVVPSLGGTYGRDQTGTWRAGLCASLLLGLHGGWRPWPEHGFPTEQSKLRLWGNMGLRLEYRRGLQGRQDNAFIVGAQFTPAVVAIPILLLLGVAIAAGGSGSMFIH
jgi:hypothetical protein